MEDKVYSILKKLEYLEEKMNDLNVNIEDVEEKNQENNKEIDDKINSLYGKFIVFQKTTERNFLICEKEVPNQKESRSKLNRCLKTYLGPSFEKFNLTWIHKLLS